MMPSAAFCRRGRPALLGDRSRIPAEVTEREANANQLLLISLTPLAFIHLVTFGRSVRFDLRVDRGIDPVELIADLSIGAADILGLHQLLRRSWNCSSC
jgi:hypothetical protein